jgi:hypothetical protein
MGRLYDLPFQYGKSYAVDRHRRGVPLRFFPQLRKVYMEKTRMNAIRTVRNQYRGINAHWHSHLLHESAWNRLHNYHIGKLMESCKARLLPLGYTAQIEESLQIRRIDSPTSTTRRADLLIRDLQPESGRAPSALLEVETAPLVELLEEDAESPYTAVAIVERAARDIVAWIELLSPANKGGTHEALAYLAKRRALLETRVTFVELDYLHDSPPTFPRIPDYHKAQPGAHPYRIALLDPHPRFRDGNAVVRAFDVDMPIPSLTIPLRGGAQLTFDFDAAYQRTFADGLFGLEDVDYAALPARFDLYGQADQTRILNRMMAVIDAAGAGIDLETAIIAPLTLAADQARAAWDAYASSL